MCFGGYMISQRFNECFFFVLIIQVRFFKATNYSNSTAKLSKSLTKESRIQKCHFDPECQKNYDDIARVYSDKLVQITREKMKKGHVE